jgi:hypothetical protein
MSFVNELISEKDKKKIDWSKFKAWPFSQPHHPWKWTIDRVRDVFLVALEGRGPDGDRPETYAFSWKNEVIRFEASINSGNEIASDFDLFWCIYKIKIPPHLASKHDEILNDLKEAIDAYGMTYKREHIKSVHIEIDEAGA